LFSEDGLPVNKISSQNHLQMVDGRGLVGEALRFGQASNHSSLPANSTVHKTPGKGVK
jgi:hypothetical protein